VLVELAKTGLSEAEVLSFSPDYSLGRLYGLLERRRRVSREDAQTLFSDRYLMIQPSLDQSAHRFWGLAVGPDGEIIANALHRRESELLGRRRPGRRHLGRGGGHPLLGSQAGTRLSFRDPLWRKGEADRLRSSRSLLLRPGGSDPPALRALVMARDMGMCAIEGCRSRYRLQIHHLHPRSRGGGHHPDNLTTLCWYHHHVAIHGMGMEIDPNSPVHRRRLRWPGGTDPPSGRRPPRILDLKQLIPKFSIRA
ncbi:MAG TPA: HNH endonuclease signature motif containing protein, partial [Acidimicrobiia bacterium]|nr:HNH endonuclease signature motif containing protein [Acidimicrobiia bacterium]